MKKDMVCPISHRPCIFCGLYRGRHYHLPFCESYRRRHGVSRAQSSSMERQHNKGRPNSVAKLLSLTKGGSEISELPRLRLESPIIGYPEEICDLEQARDKLRFDHGIVAVEGRVISSYHELVQLAAQDRYKNKGILKVKVLPVIGGG